MRNQAAFFVSALMAVGLMTWGLSIISAEMRTTKKLGEAKRKHATVTSVPTPKCELSTPCAVHQFPVQVASGAADIVGPRICFDGKIIMSHVQNNVGLGLNIVVMNDSSGSMESSTILDMRNGVEKDILRYMKAIKPGTIVLTASFGDVTLKMTDKIREAFVGMGSTLIKSLKYRDNWVFVGRGGTRNKSSFEKRSVNDENTNMYDKFPGAVEVTGCFPPKSDDDKQ